MEAVAAAAAAGQKRSRRRFNVRFAPGRVKKIMQRDADVGRVVKSVPVIICFKKLYENHVLKLQRPELQRSARALEMFLQSFLSQSYRIMKSNHSNILSLTHIKQCVESEKHFDFLKDPVERAMSAASQRDQIASLWPLHRPVLRDSSVKNPPEPMEVTKTRSRLDSLDVDDSSSSESELFICL